MIVVAEKFGQLGNRLFLFAHFVAFAESHGVAVANPAFDEYAPYFPAFAADPLCRYPRPPGFAGAPGPAVVARRRAAAAVAAGAAAALARAGRPVGPVGLVEAGGPGDLDMRDPAFVREARARRVLLARGWLFRDPVGLAEHADLLRELFTPAPEHVRRVDAAERAARAEADVLLGVHVRRGDYASYAGGRHFHGPEVYRAAIERVRELLPRRRVGVLACSDEPAIVGQLGEGVVAGPGHLIEDMYALARCDLLLGPPSTFSAWASFHGRVPLRHLDEPGVAFGLEDFAGPGGERLAG